MNVKFNNTAYICYLLFWEILKYFRTTLTKTYFGCSINIYRYMTYLANFILNETLCYSINEKEYWDISKVKKFRR